MALWGNIDQADNKPKYLTTADKNATVGVSVSEAQQPINRNKGINTPGWVKYVTYTDAQGNTRHKTETLVAMGGVPGLTGDAADDTVAADPITISVQPANQSAIQGATATFSVTAATTPVTTLSYQWQKSDDAGVTWNAIVGATSASYTTGALTVAADNNDRYRVVISATGRANVTSNSATLTVTAS